MTNKDNKNHVKKIMPSPLEYDDTRKYWAAHEKRKLVDKQDIDKTSKVGYNLVNNSGLLANKVWNFLGTAILDENWNVYLLGPTLILKLPIF